MMQVEEARRNSEQLRLERDNTKAESLDRERLLNLKIAALESRLQIEQKVASNALQSEAIVKAERNLLLNQLESLKGMRNKD